MRNWKKDYKITLMNLTTRRRSLRRYLLKRRQMKTTPVAVINTEFYQDGGNIFTERLI